MNDKYNSFARPNIERSILSICLQFPEKLISVKEYNITADMFIIPANRYIFHAINYLYSKNTPPSPITILEVTEDTSRRKIIEEFGGVEYITLLKEQYVNKDEVKILCNKLKQAYTRKQISLICEDSITEMVSDSSEIKNPSELINVVEEKLLCLTNKISNIKSIYKVGNNIEDILKIRASSPNKIAGLKTGWKRFDELTNGGQPSDLFMVCARAKTGKSTVLTNWAVNLAIKDKLPVIYFDTEMDSKQQEDRILSILTGIPHKEIISGLFNLDTENGLAKDKVAKIKTAIEEMKKGNYYHMYLPNFTIDKVKTIARSFKMQYGISAIFFDYLKFPSSEIKSLRNSSEWQMLGYITSSLKDLAGELEIPIYSACQENRSSLTGKKSELNIGGSDRILQLVSKLMFLYNKDEETILREGELNGNQQLYIAFQRNGESDCKPINIQFDREICTQREV